MRSKVRIDKESNILDSWLMETLSSMTTDPFRDDHPKTTYNTIQIEASTENYRYNFDAPTENRQQKSGHTDFNSHLLVLVLLLHCFLSANNETVGFK